MPSPKKPRKPTSPHPEQARTQAGPTPVDKARQVAGWLHDKKARQVMALDVQGFCPITETLVIATATSPRHAKGLADHVLAQVDAAGFAFLGMEGLRDGNWVLVDLNDVLVHIFQPSQRELYNLEGLWSEGREIPLQLDGEEPA